MADIHDVAERHKRALRRNEARAIRTMTTSYKQIESYLIEQVIDILSTLDRATISSFFTLRRTKDLLADIERLLGEHADNVIRPTIIQLAENALSQAQSHSDELVKAALGRGPKGFTLPLASLSEAQIAQIVATLDSGPLAKLLDGFGRVAAEKARRDLLLGVTLGEHPTKVARRLRQSLNVTNSRAVLIARTEQLRAYREGTRTYYQNNKHVVEKWIWSASLSKRTCAACWALHGREFDTDERMPTHPACRCSMVPKTKTWKELGFPNVKESRPQFESGEDAFAKQPESIKKAVLGPNAYAAYQNGDVSLNDFIHVDHSREWGTTFRRGSLHNALNR
jgi:SPP1 gp7 family putative phage head morphogenesis protein